MANVEAEVPSVERSSNRLGQLRELKAPVLLRKIAIVYFEVDVSCQFLRAVLASCVDFCLVKPYCRPEILATV